MSTARPELPREIVRQVHTIEHKHLWRIALFLGLYLGSGWLTVTLFRVMGAPWWGYLALLPLYLLAAGSLHGISLFTHEGVHGVLSKNGTVNHLVSAICAWPVLQTFAAYRVLHLRHHKHLGITGDPDHFKNYAARPWLVFAMHWGRLILGYPAYITAIPILGLLQGDAKDRAMIIAEVAAVLGLVTVVMMSPIPGFYLLHGWLIPMLLINTMVNIRGMSQHTLLEHADDVVKGTRSILTNPVTTFFMCNENYHLEHHLYPGVPWYHLPQVHKELRPELEAQGAPFVPSYWAFVSQFIRASMFWKPVGTVSLKEL